MLSNKWEWEWSGWDGGMAGDDAILAVRKGKTQLCNTRGVEVSVFRLTEIRLTGSAQLVESGKVIQNTAAKIKRKLEKALQEKKHWEDCQARPSSSGGTRGPEYRGC
jgi:hypothetical protein